MRGDDVTAAEMIAALRARLQRLEARATETKARINALRPLEIDSCSTLMREGRALAREHEASAQMILDLERGYTTPTEALAELSRVQQSSETGGVPVAVELLREVLSEPRHAHRYGARRVG